MESEIVRKNKRKRRTRRLKGWHKWAGLVFTLFLLMFAVSGIFLNHRRAISAWDVPRNLLPSGYRYDNWNNGSVRGTFLLSPDSLLLYGNNGIWLSDPQQSGFVPYGKGMRRGADNNTVTNIVRTATGDIFAATTFHLYRLDTAGGIWRSVGLPTRERISDIAADDSGRLVVLGRSRLFTARTPYDSFRETELPAPEGYKKETSWFRTIWTLHSGELFGIPGRLVVDLIGVLTIILCITGIILFCCPKIIKRRSKRRKDTSNGVKVMRGSLRWHNKAGAWFLVLLLLIAVTGMCLRPPLMIAVVRGKTAPLPGSTLDSPNPWHDKLRSLRFDSHAGEWLLHTSEGFYTLRELSDTPQRVKGAPPVSVMGINVLRQQDSTRWTVGSFSGLYLWNRSTGEILDAYTLEPYVRRGGMPVFSNAVSGYSDDFAGGPVAFDYSEGAKRIGTGTAFAPMPDTFGNGKMSLWHLSLEVHVGRIYASLFGNTVTGMWVFLSGTLFIVILITGYIVYRRSHRHRKNLRQAGKETNPPV